ncbi:MAG: noncanonical pyrimidine nucleotidase, YjjG family [Chitinophagaceae bacterium]|nr:noncanonical pyrimidine nucleotidase, YjjG family [Chitinophagaceae bacterium]
MAYRHLFFDLDHTLWDFDANSRLTLQELYVSEELKKRGVHDFDLFHKNYLLYNDKLWERYRNGHIKAEELRWKRMWLTLVDFKIGDEKLARYLGQRFVDMLPCRTLLFPDTIEVLQYLTDKNYSLHLITNGFEEVQHNKIRNSGIAPFFREVITSEGSNSLKPRKEIFDYAFQKAGASPSESIILGDSLEADILGGINAGIDQVHVNHLNAGPGSITPTYTVYSLKELKGIL